MMKTVFVMGLYSLLPLIPLVLMFLSAHAGNVAYTCAMGFLALFFTLFAMLHDINVTLYHIYKCLEDVVYQEEEEDDNQD